MAASRETSNGPDVVDVATLWQALEGINRCTAVVTLRSMAEGNISGVSMGAVAYRGEVGSPEAEVLGSASVTCLGMSRQTLGPALFRLLYLLDGDIGRRELLGENTAT